MFNKKQLKPKDISNPEPLKWMYNILPQDKISNKTNKMIDNLLDELSSDNYHRVLPQERNNNKPQNLNIDQLLKDISEPLSASNDNQINPSSGIQTNLSKLKDVSTNYGIKNGGGITNAFSRLAEKAYAQMHPLQNVAEKAYAQIGGGNENVKENVRFVVDAQNELIGKLGEIAKARLNDIKREYKSNGKSFSTRAMVVTGTQTLRDILLQFNGLHKKRNELKRQIESDKLVKMVKRHSLLQTIQNIGKEQINILEKIVLLVDTEQQKLRAISNKQKTDFVVIW